MNDSPAVPQAHPARRFVFAPWMAGCLAACVAAVVLFGARPTFHWLKDARARHFAAESESLTAEAKYPEAFAKAQAAYQLQPTEPSALRAMASLLEKVNPPAAVPFLRLLSGSPEVTPHDLSHYAEACLQQGNVEEAEGQVVHLLRLEPDNPENLRLAARVYGARGALDTALRFAGQAAQADPTNVSGQFLLAQMQLSAKDPTLQKTGWESMWKLAHDPGPVGLQTLRGMTARPSLSTAEQEEVEQLLRAHPLATEQDRLLAFEVELRLHPGHRDEILGRAIDQAKGKDGTTLRTVGTWLNGLGEYGKTLDVLPEKTATSRQDLFLVYLDALAALNRWNDVGRLLVIKDVPLADVFVRLFQARVAEMEGRKDDAETLWRRAHTAATGNPSQMYYLAQYAEKLGNEDQAVQAYLSLSANVPTARLAYENLLRLAEKRGDAASSGKFLGEMLKRWPSEPAVRNDYAYMNALLGQNLPQSRTMAEGLVVALPAELPHRTALALALLRMNAPAAALAVYDGLEVPWDKAPARDRAVFAAVLGANGRTAQANKMAATIALAALFPEERDLVKPWLKKS